MNIYDESIKIKLLIINKIKVFPIITSALSISFFPLAIEQSGAPPIPNKFVNAATIVTIGKVNPNPVSANEELP